MGKPDASRTLRFELNRLDLADMTVKPHTIKIVGPAPTPDIAGLCERLRKPLDYTLHLYQCDVDTTMANAADTLERQAAEIERLRGALDLASRRFYVFRDMTDHTSDRVCLATWADEARAALTGEDND